MELREYWRVFKRRAWIPILLLIVTVATASALSFLSKPEYAATATVTAKTTGTTAANTVAFPDVATGGTVLSAVIQKLNLSMTADELSNQVKVSSGKNNVYKVTVTDPDADRAATLANTLAQQAADQYIVANADPGSSAFDDSVAKARQIYLKRYLDAATAMITFNRQHPNALNSADIGIASQAMQLKVAEEAAASAYQDFESQTTNNDVNQIAQAIDF